MNILIVDDDQGLGRSLQLHLEREGYATKSASTAREGMELLQANAFNLAFLDLNLPDQNGLELLGRMREVKPSCLYVMITGVQDSKATIDAIRLGAFDYLRKPLDLDNVLSTVKKAQHQSERSSPSGATPIRQEKAAPNDFIGAHPSVIEVLKQVALYGASNVPVLIQGESGTGKELVARALHETSSPGRPFIAVNCSAVVATLLESELFGHVRGAFTGADNDKPGKLELAEEGTVFLDEIGDMTFELQAKLLRVLQEREFERVGDTKTIAFRARVLAATHRNLKQMIAEDRFREDLYYRLAVSTVHVPPLRERRSDIPLLVERLLARLSNELHKELEGIEPEAGDILQQYNWPGNVRELVNVLTRLLLISRGPIITADETRQCMGILPAKAEVEEPLKPLSQVEKEHVERVLNATNWNITRAARVLDITRVTLRKKIEDYNLKHHVL